MAVVTISRVHGSEGDRIALKVAQELGYDLVDTALITEVAERAGVSIDKVRAVDEQLDSRAVELLKGFITPRMSKVLAGEEEHHLDPKTYLEFIKTIISGLAEKGNVVIVGRASQFILRDNDSAYHVRIESDENFRIERIRLRHDVITSDARDIMKKSDSMRRNFIARYFGEDWANPIFYHLVINSAKNGVDETAHVIVEAVRKFSDTHEYIPGIRDRRKGERRKTAVRRRRDRRAGEELWTPGDTSRAVRKGKPVRLHLRADRRRTERRTTDRRGAKPKKG